MQALWSRAAQTRSSCHCSACLHAATGIARRTTTTASRRRLKIGDLFTACYSTILGTAAFADAKAKEERRKQWDKAIAEAKAEIPMDVSDGLQRASLDQAKDMRSKVLVKPITSYDYNEVSIRNIQYDDLQTTLDLHLKQALESSHGTSESRSPESEEDWSDEAEADPNFLPREPASRLHVDKMEGMVSKLVTRLLVRSRDLSVGKKPSASDPENFLQMKGIATQLELLRGMDTRLPSYTFYNPQGARKEQRQLNNALETLFGQTATDGSNIKVIIAKMCYNLLVSSTPPSIQTYDILIRSLTRLRLHDLAQIVVDSFLLDSRFMPTSTTIKLILDHYSARKDANGFRAIVNRMRAVDGDMRIKKRSIHSLHKSKEQKWALTSKVLHKGCFLREKVSRDSNIFDSLINGFLDLDQLRSAVRYLRAALREGVQLSSETLCRIVVACTRVLDFKDGLLVLRALLDQWEGENASRVVYSSAARFAIRRLFCLCGIEPSLKSTTPLPGKVSRVAVKNLQRHVAITSLEEKLHNFSARITSVEAMLAHAAESCGDTRTIYIGKALSVLYSASNRERARSLKLEKYDNENAALTSAKMGNQMDWISIQYRELATKWKKQYDIAIKHNPTFSCADRLEIISIYQEGRSVLPQHRLFQKIASAKKSESKSEIMDSATIEQAAATKEVPAVLGKASNPLQSPSTSTPKTAASHISHHNLAFPRLPPTSPWYCLPLPSTHDKAGIEAAAG